MALVVEYLDTLRLHKKRRRYADSAPSPIDTLPATWRELLAQWLSLGGNSRWETLLKKAGLAQKTEAETLLDWLLNNGWAVVDEARLHGDWWPYRVELREQKALRQQLGMVDMETVQSTWQVLRIVLQTAAETHPPLLPVLSDLDSMPVNRAIKRAELVQALLTWQADNRSGTYRDFSLHARHTTKALTATEWRWLNTYFDLSVFNIEQHTPLLYLAANLELVSASAAISLQAMPDFAGLTPKTIRAIQAARGNIEVWLLVENRTSFERVALQRKPSEGVIWLPGFPPSWWQQSVSHLLQIAPAPARIACDPDPAGVSIAQQAIQVWQQHGLDAQPWQMSADELLNSKHTQPLTEADRNTINHLLQQPQLHPTCIALLQAMQQYQIKVEQESYL